MTTGAGLALLPCVEFGVPLATVDCGCWLELAGAGYEAAAPGLSADEAGAETEGFAVAAGTDVGVGTPGTQATVAMAPTTMPPAIHFDNAEIDGVFIWSRFAFVYIGHTRETTDRCTYLRGRCGSMCPIAPRPPQAPEQRWLRAPG